MADETFDEYLEGTARQCRSDPPQVLPVAKRKRKKKHSSGNGHDTEQARILDPGAPLASDTRALSRTNTHALMGGFCTTSTNG